MKDKDLKCPFKTCVHVDDCEVLRIMGRVPKDKCSYHRLDETKGKKRKE